MAKRIKISTPSIIHDLLNSGDLTEALSAIKSSEEKIKAFAALASIPIRRRLGSNFKEQLHKDLALDVYYSTQAMNSDESSILEHELNWGRLSPNQVKYLLVNKPEFFAKDDILYRYLGLIAKLPLSTFKSLQLNFSTERLYHFITQHLRAKANAPKRELLLKANKDLRDVMSFVETGKTTLPFNKVSFLLRIWESGDTHPLFKSWFVPLLNTTTDLKPYLSAINDFKIGLLECYKTKLLTNSAVISAVKSWDHSSDIKFILAQEEFATPYLRNHWHELMENNFEVFKCAYKGTAEEFLDNVKTGPRKSSNNCYLLSKFNKLFPDYKDTYKVVQVLELKTVRPHLIDYTTFPFDYVKKSLLAHFSDLYNEHYLAIKKHYPDLLNLLLKHAIKEDLHATDHYKRYVSNFLEQSRMVCSFKLLMQEFESHPTYLLKLLRINYTNARSKLSCKPRLHKWLVFYFASINIDLNPEGNHIPADWVSVKKYLLTSQFATV
jgi:hypothetical protein